MSLLLCRAVERGDRIEPLFLLRVKGNLGAHEKAVKSLQLLEGFVKSYVIGQSPYTEISRKIEKNPCHTI